MKEHETLLHGVWLIYSLLGAWKVNAQTEKYTCGSLLREPSGIITSPNKGPDDTYESNQRCRWTLVAQEHKMIQLEVEEMDIEEHGECSNDYLAIYDGNDIIGKGYYCGTDVPSVVTFNSRVAYVDFVSNELVNRKGFKAKYVQVKDSDCGYVMTLRAGSLRSVDSVVRYINNVVCIWMIEKEHSAEHLQVLIVHMNIPPSNHCTDSYLMIRGNALTPTRLCGSVPPPLFTTTSKYSFILFQSEFNNYGSEFAAIYTNSDEDFKCGGILTKTFGKIVSVDSNNDTLYDTNLECVWVIVAPPNYVIELNFTYIDIEYHKNCEWDHVRVFEGLNSYPFDGLIGWYCGGDIPDPILSTSNIVYVEFLSDDDSVFTGFEIVYRHIPEENSTSNLTTTFVTESTVHTETTKLIIGNGVDSHANYRLTLFSVCVLLKMIRTVEC